MKKAILAILLSLCCAFTNAQDTVISGYWYSKDGTRQYLIRETANGWEAFLVHTKRAGENEGRLILGKLRKKGNKYRGIIYSASDDLSTTVTISAPRKNKQVLILKLKRMLLLDVTIKWYRDPS
jgi:hypothetical protein